MPVYAALHSQIRKLEGIANKFVERISNINDRYNVKGFSYKNFEEGVRSKELAPQENPSENIESTVEPEKQPKDNDPPQNLESHESPLQNLPQPLNHGFIEKVE